MIIEIDKEKVNFSNLSPFFLFMEKKLKQL